jgi:hypothetical protein
MKVCAHCFNDIELKQFIVSNSVDKGRCDYCSEDIDTEILEIDDLLDFFTEFFGIFKEDAKGIPLSELIQKDWNLFIGNPASNVLLSDVLLALNSAITNSYAPVKYIDEIIECTAYWETLKKNIKWGRRFLTNIDKLQDLGWDRFFEPQEILPQSELLFRARLHYNGDQKIFECRDMGCPDKSKVTGGRANPQGIPYLYLSKNIETTLYEIRASFLDEVSVGTFKIKVDSGIILVDFTASVSAFLNIDQIIEYTKSMLLKKYISADLSKPMRRYDSELEYIPTQFVCEYIRHFSGADGILFNSSLHTEGKNVVLFSQEKVECISVAMHRVTNVVIEAKTII